LDEPPEQTKEDPLEMAHFSFPFYLLAGSLGSIAFSFLFEVNIVYIIKNKIQKKLQRRHIKK